MRADRIAGRFVTASGVAIIAAILAILFVLVLEVYPLFLPAKFRQLPTASLGATDAPLAVTVDEYREDAVVLTRRGVRLVPLSAGEARDLPLPSLGTASIEAAAVLPNQRIALELSDGRLLPLSLHFELTYPEGRRRIEASVSEEAAIALASPGQAFSAGKFQFAAGSHGPVAVAAIGPRSVRIVSVEETTSLMGGTTREETRRDLELALGGEAGDIAALALDTRGDDLLIGTTRGRIARIDLRNLGNLEGTSPEGTRAAAEEVVLANQSGAEITTLGFLNGDRTLVVGDAKGGVSTWQVLMAEDNRRHLSRVHSFESHAAPVRSLSPSRRDKGFVTGDASGLVKLHYATTGKTLLSYRAGSHEIVSLIFAPKSDGIVAIGRDGTLHHAAIANPHPEITLRSLFGKVWYEGYNAPGYTWQSTGGTDDFEAKFSLTPLVYGTLKGTFYALLVAIPLALGAALYTSQFMHPSLKSILKPAVEIMAALPSVVLGFIAGLWLAPMVERIVPGLLVMPVVMGAALALAAFVWSRVPTGFRARVRPGWELAMLIPVVVASGIASVAVGRVLEGWLLSGDYRTYLSQVLGITYDQRNSLVVGLAMGFAVIPIIFTVAEDSLSGVPQSLTAGSLALGATRWQTAVRTVLPTASPGIFSAVMIGFGRAVGETMIVLMATGNTPVMDASMFNGFRALSANIAVELPEAAQGSTLYRVLFLAALLLFVMTFAVNTAAELVRLRLRKKYRTYE